ncbi:hydrolase [bacterium]|nr:hydrolase [bacterium]
MKNLSIQDSVLVVVDIQERIIPKIFDYRTVVSNAVALIKSAEILNIPIIVTEQYPKGLGSTISEIKDLIMPWQPIEKICFSCFGNSDFSKKLNELKKDNIILCGIESHVCITQTALDGLKSGYSIFFVKDAISSRTENNRETGFERMAQAGAIPVSTEMAMFELLKEAGTAKFKQMVSLIR